GHPHIDRTTAGAGTDGPHRPVGWRTIPTHPVTDTTVLRRVDATTPAAWDYYTVSHQHQSSVRAPSRCVAPTRKRHELAFTRQNRRGFSPRRPAKRKRTDQHGYQGGIGRSP